MVIFYATVVFCDDQQLFGQAKEAFVGGTWLQALQLYKKIEHKNSAVWQNIGNCYFNLERYDQALVAWNRACAGRPNYHQIATMCESENSAYQKLNLPIIPAWKCWIKKIVLIIPDMELKLIFLILLCCLLWFLYCYWRGSVMSVVDHKLLVFILFCSVVCSAIWYARTVILHKDQAIVVKSDVLVYAGPERTFHVIEKLQQGSLVHIMHNKQGMYQIKQEALRGWVVQDTVEYIYNYE